MKPTVFITGASSGFGEACARRFAQAGWRLVITGRRKDRLEALAAELSPTAEVLPLVLDVRDRAAMQAAIDGLPGDFAKLRGLVNNAGLALGVEPAQACSLDDWETMVDTNVKGLMYATHMLLPRLIAHGAGASIVNIGSVAGRWPYPGGNVYGATKAFVRQFSLNLRADLLGTAIRVTDIEPGLCGGTEFSNVRFHGDDDKAAKVYADVQPLTAEDIADSIYWIATRPAHVNINTIELMPVAQSFAGLSVHRG